MQQKYIVKWLIFMITITKTVHSIEVFIMKSNDLNNTDPEPVQFDTNTTYEIPLFQMRYMIIRINRTDLYHHTHATDRQMVGFKLQVTSTDVRVVRMRKEITLPADMNDTNTFENVLVEDLFILRTENAATHIFNTYPAPSLVYLEKSDHIDAVWSIQSASMEETTINLVMDIFYDDDFEFSQKWSLNILVTPPKRAIDKAFYIILPFLVVFISIQMGILLDTKVLLDLVKNPKAVIVGFCAQYGLMPILAMCIAKVFRYSPLYSLALFVIGCCPGSGASNQWTLLFDGDVNLSALMSFVSTASSFLMMPLYFYTIGKTYMEELSIYVPFLGLFRSLALVVVPYSIGIIISHFSSKTRDLVERLVKPMMLFLLLFFLVFGTLVNWYLIVTIDLYTALTAPLLPYLGFILGALLAYIFGLSTCHIKTVGIEAGIQNVGIAFMIIYYSFPQPYATKATVVPLVVGFLTTKPFWIIYLIRNRIKKYKKTKGSKTKDSTASEVNNKEAAPEEAEKFFTERDLNIVSKKTSDES